MQINKDNGLEVAMWLLQCDSSDFNDPLDRIAEWYEALSEAYVYHRNNAKASNASASSKKAKMVVLAHLLFQHLNKPARTSLKQQLNLPRHDFISAEKAQKKLGDNVFYLGIENKA